MQALLRDQSGSIEDYLCFLNLAENDGAQRTQFCSREHHIGFMILAENFGLDIIRLFVAVV